MRKKHEIRIKKDGKGEVIGTIEKGAKEVEVSIEILMLNEYLGTSTSKELVLPLTFWDQLKALVEQLDYAVNEYKTEN